MQNNFELDTQLAIEDAYSRPRGFASLVCSAETLKKIAEQDIFDYDFNIVNYKGHPVIIDNNLPLGKFIVLPHGIEYNGGEYNAK